MKKKLIMILLAVCLMLTACGEKNYETGKIDKWPKNEYTEKVPKPEHGKPSEMIIDENMGYCSVILTDITREESEEYVEALKEEGFEELEGLNDLAALGIPMKKDNVYLNIALSGETLGINVSMGKE